jgi:hypothetical protein
MVGPGGPGPGRPGRHRATQVTVTSGDTVGMIRGSVSESARVAQAARSQTRTVALCCLGIRRTRMAGDDGAGPLAPGHVALAIQSGRPTPACHDVKDVDNLTCIPSRQEIQNVAVLYEHGKIVLISLTQNFKRLA